MSRIIIELPGGKELKYLVNLLRRLDFVRSVRVEENNSGPSLVDEYVKPGQPMSLEEFRQRIHTAEAEDEAGLSLSDEELYLDI